MKRIIHPHTLVHAVMSVFALVSVQNIAIFFATAGHPPGAAWTLGVALGLALVTISIMLTRIDLALDGSALGWLLTAGTVLALVSGGIQSAEYAKHLDRWAAIGLGYGLPLGGEILLAFATAAYTAAERRRKLRMATEGTTDRIAECVTDALSDVDVSRVRAYVENRVDEIVRAQVDNVAQLWLPDTMTNRPMRDGLATAQGDDHNSNNREVQQFGPQNLPRARQKRTQQRDTNKAAKQDAILALLHLPEHVVNGLSVTAIANSIQIHRDTARKYLTELETRGQLTYQSRRWRLAKESES